MVEQLPSHNFKDFQYNEHPEDHWTNNPHIAGLRISAIGIYGQSNEIDHRWCAVCRKFFLAIKEEITLGYLETTY